VDEGQCRAITGLFIIEPSVWDRRESFRHIET
jgi:hypothetical protein